MKPRADDLARLAETALSSPVGNVDALTARGEDGLLAVLDAVRAGRPTGLPFLERLDNEGEVLAALARAIPEAFVAHVRKGGRGASSTVLQAAASALAPATDALVLEALGSPEPLEREAGARAVVSWQWRADGPWRLLAEEAVAPCLYDAEPKVRRTVLSAVEALGGRQMLAAVEAFAASAVATEEERRVLALVRARMVARIASENAE